MAEATVSTKNQIVIPREAREALQLKPGDKLLVVVCGERVIVLQKPKSHHAAIRGLARGAYPRDYLQEERQSWEWTVSAPFFGITAGLPWIRTSSFTN
jgi:AbrB family looped-hinge helix DNA binding protein